MSTHNICFYGELKKIIPELTSPPKQLLDHSILKHFLSSTTQRISGVFDDTSGISFSISQKEKKVSGTPTKRFSKALLMGTQTICCLIGRNKNKYPRIIT